MDDGDAGRHAAPNSRQRPAAAGRVSNGRRILLGAIATVLFAGCLVGVHAAIGGEHRNDAARRAAAQAATSGTAAPAQVSTRAAAPTSGRSSSSTASNGPTPWWSLSPAPATPLVTAAPTGSVRPTASGLQRALAPLLANPALAGDTVGLVVADPASGQSILAQHATTGMAPASTAKLATAVAALETLGASKQFTTEVVRGAAAGQIVLVGGGDPTLSGPAAVGSADPGFPAPARLSDLAAQTASALKAAAGGASVRVTLGYDTTLFGGPAEAPGWRPVYISEGDVAPVSALEVDEGRPDPHRAARSLDPALLAAQDFAALLSADGVTVDGGPAAVTTSRGAAVLGSVRSPVVAGLVQRMLGRSDNDIAEALARQVAIAEGMPPTFAGGTDAVRAVLTRLGVEPAGLAMVDSSGLSHTDRVYPAALVQVLDLVVGARHPELSSVLAALPVAGFSGTLAGRYLSPPAAAAAGDVRAKTGTLDGTAALAGYLQDDSGELLTFALVAGNVADGATAQTESALDKVAAGLGACGCG